MVSRQRPTPGKPLRIISVGSASFYKDHRTLLRACIELKIRGIPISLTLIGLKIWGDLYEKTVDFINDNNLSISVTGSDNDYCNHHKNNGR